MVPNIVLRFVSSAEAERQIRSYLPVIADEQANIHSTDVHYRVARVDRELSRTSPERANHLRRLCHLSEQQRSAILLDRTDGHASRRRSERIATYACHHRLVTGIEN